MNVGKTLGAVAVVIALSLQACGDDTTTGPTSSGSSGNGGSGASNPGGGGPGGGDPGSGGQASGGGPGSGAAGGSGGAGGAGGGVVSPAVQAACEAVCEQLASVTAQLACAGVDPDCVGDCTEGGSMAPECEEEFIAFAECGAEQADSSVCTCKPGEATVECDVCEDEIGAFIACVQM